MTVNDGARSTLTLSVSDMTCGSCLRHVEAALTEVKGVDAARVDLQGGRATVSYDPNAATAAQLIAAVEAAGYRAEVATSAPPAGLQAHPGGGRSSMAS